MSTPTFALPYPSLSSIPNVPADLQALANATEAAILKSRVQTLSANQFTPITPLGTYPVGISMLWLTDAEAKAANWPFQIAAHVVTIASSQGGATTPSHATQLWSSAQPVPALFMRNTRTTTSWGPWWRIGPAIAGYSVLAAKVVNGVGSGTITLPKYSFLVPPRVTATVSTGIPQSVHCGIGNPATATSFTAYVHRLNSMSGVGFNWIAADVGAPSTPVTGFAVPYSTEVVPSVDATFRHQAGSACPEKVNDPRIVPIPQDQSEWNGAFDSTCGEPLDRIA